MVDISVLKKELKVRDPKAHKGDFGKDLIIAGSELMAGAAILSSRAALRSGAGLVYLSAEKEMYDVIHLGVPEVVIVDRSLDDLSKYDAILIGPGLGDNENTRDLVIKVLKNFNKSIVIDADALNVIAKYDLYNLVKEYQADIILTPHEGEAKRLAKKDLDRASMVKYLYDLTKKIIVLKGSETIVYNGHEMYINETGNPGMATAGSGDVLSGLMLSLLGQKIGAFKAAALSTYIHGMAGDMVKVQIGEDGMIASDIVISISLAIKNLKEK